MVRFTDEKHTTVFQAFFHQSLFGKSETTLRGSYSVSSALINECFLTLIELASKVSVELFLVTGDSSNDGNERAGELAIKIKLARTCSDCFSVSELSTEVHKSISMKHANTWHP